MGEETVLRVGLLESDRQKTSPDSHMQPTDFIQSPYRSGGTGGSSMSKGKVGSTISAVDRAHSVTLTPHTLPHHTLSSVHDRKYVSCKPILVKGKACTLVPEAGRE